MTMLGEEEKRPPSASWQVLAHQVFAARTSTRHKCNGKFFCLHSACCVFFLSFLVLVVFLRLYCVVLCACVRCVVFATASRLLLASLRLFPSTATYLLLLLLYSCFCCSCAAAPAVSSTLGNPQPTSITIIIASCPVPNVQLEKKLHFFLVWSSSSRRKEEEKGHAYQTCPKSKAVMFERGALCPCVNLLLGTDFSHISLPTHTHTHTNMRARVLVKNGEM